MKGCLTTISTFQVEISTLPTKSAYLYALTSIAVSQALLLVINLIYVSQKDAPYPTSCSVR